MRIAFAEDDEQLRGSVARGLREAGNTVALAGHGGEALALVPILMLTGSTRWRTGSPD